MMNIETLYIHLVISGLAIFFLYRKYIQALRLKASYDLYKIRDELIYLVASGVIKETDKVFEFYYERINFMLSMAPNVGLQDILDILFNHANIQKSLEENKRKSHEVMKQDSMAIAEVRNVVENYYCGVRMLILSHSSVFKVIYILSSQFRNAFIRSIAKYLLVRIDTFQDATRVVQYVEYEAGLVKDKRFKNMRKALV